MLAELDTETYNAMWRAQSRHWTHTEELLRALCQLTDRQTRVLAGMFGGRSAVARLGKPFDYKRPGKPRRNVVRPRDFARAMLGA